MRLQAPCPAGTHRAAVCREQPASRYQNVVSTAISEEFVIGVRGIDRVDKYGLMSAHTVSSYGVDSNACAPYCFKVHLQVELVR
jgi:hypothetical protein